MTRREALEDPKHYRLFINPDTNDSVYRMYKDARDSFWIDEEIDSELRKDGAQWAELDPKIQDLIIHQIAFFLIADGRVNQTISDSIESRITNREVLLWYNFQKMIEDIHNIVYVKLADTYIRSPAEKVRVFNAVESYPVIGKKIDWIKHWLGEDNDIHRLDDTTVRTLGKLKQFCTGVMEQSRVLRDSEPELDPEILALWHRIDEPKPDLFKQIYINMIMEGLWFQGSFCIIFWVYHQYGKLPGLTKANEFISRDEGMHTLFGAKMLGMMQYRLPQQTAHDIMREAVDLEIEFMGEALPTGLLNMNIDLMSQYLRYVADWLLGICKYEKLYYVSNPFSFMDKQSISVRMSDFFIDNNVSEYGIGGSSSQELCFDD